MKRIFPFLLVLLLGLFIAASVTLADLPKRKIVVFRPDVSFSERALIISSYQGKFNKHLGLVNGVAADIPSRWLEKLSKDPRVLRIDPDVEVFALPADRRIPVEERGICDWWPSWPGCPPTPSPTPTPVPSPSPTPDPTASPPPVPTVAGSGQTLPWGIERIRADEAWVISSGSGVKVAVVDTGIDRDHPDLDGNLAGCLNFIQSWKTCEDDNGHGTHVSGIIAAENNGIGVVGVSPQAKIYALKVLNRRGSGYLSDVIEGLDWAVRNSIQVVNMSLGTGSDITSFREAVERVYQAGITQVAAAGNSGPGANTVIYPAKYPQVIAAAATDIENRVPSWSSRGNEVDIAAPGVSIYSTYPNNRYRTLSGTSMAAPHVTGAVALRLYLYPAQTPSEIRTKLQSTATSLGLDPTLVGAGLVDAYNLVTAP